MGLRVYWLRGEKVTLADKCGVTPQLLSDLICGRRRANKEEAELVERNAAAMGIFLSANDLMFPHASTNPLLNTPAARKARKQQ